MRIEKRSGGEERRILIGMIVDVAVLGRVAARWQRDEGMFASGWANLVGGWCVSFFERYGAAPGRAIAAKFESWATGADRDKDMVQLIDQFLSSLSDEYEGLAEEMNADYLIDLAGAHFNKIRAARLTEALQGDLESGKLEDFTKRIGQYGQVELGGGAGVDVLHDKAVTEAAFAQGHESLITYPHALGEFFGKALQRDSLIGIMAPEKRGKTWWLMDIAWRAMCQRRRVAYFEVGDLSQDQVIHRWGCRAAKHPIDPDSLRGGPVRVPTGIERQGDAETASVTGWSVREFGHGLTWTQAWEAFQETAERYVKSKETYLRLSTHPNSSISVGGVREILRGWERTGWVPDVVVIDYADILAPPSGVGEGRDQINTTWKQLRAMSQSLHCCVVTGTQADAASYQTDTLGRQNFSEDKRKYAHVTGMLGINATEAEADEGIQRLNWIVLRGSKYSARRCVHVAGCLDIGNPALHSTF